MLGRANTSRALYLLSVHVDAAICGISDEADEADVAHNMTRADWLGESAGDNLVTFTNDVTNNVCEKACLQHI